MNLKQPDKSLLSITSPKQNGSKNAKICTISPPPQIENGKSDTEESEDSSESDKEELAIRAPNELFQEFLVYTMSKQWSDAYKLCQFILMYEPEHKEANEFMPLIKQKLEENRNDESESETSGSSEDNEDDDDDDDDEESEDEDSDSSSESDDDEDNESNVGDDDDDDVQIPSNSKAKS